MQINKDNNKMKYIELKAQQEQELNNFTNGNIMFAFNKQQFNEGLQKLGLPESGYAEHLVSIGGGGYLLKSKSAEFDAIFETHNKQIKEFLSDPSNLLDALTYELCNHEYCITGRASDALEALGLNHEDIDPTIFRQARQVASIDY